MGDSVVIALSGGVDSSVAALLLTKAGYEVTGMMLRLWSEQGREIANKCCTPEAMAQARRVAARLGIPFYAIDVQRNFRSRIVEYFLSEYLSGRTPNPCIQCNMHIRWGELYNTARAGGAEYLATGHYARIERQADGSLRLLRALDRGKDQSYVLSGIQYEQLTHTLFPVGGLTKAEVRQLAGEADFETAERPDSQDLCFIAGGDYRDFIERNTKGSSRTGKILSIEGKVLGTHSGLHRYTIGQRRGIGVAAGDAQYVVGKDIQNNTLILGPRNALERVKMRVKGINWLLPDLPAGELQVQTKIRYHSPDYSARLQLENPTKAVVQFDEPVPGISPGQQAVFYDGEICLGGGTICGDEEEQ